MALIASSGTTLERPAAGPRRTLAPSAPRRHRALPIPPLDWNDDVARATAHLYERVKTLIPPVEWPFFAPTIAAKARRSVERMVYLKS